MGPPPSGPSPPTMGVCASIGPTGVAPGVMPKAPVGPGVPLTGVSSQRERCPAPALGTATAPPTTGVASHALPTLRPGVGVSSHRFLREGVALGSATRPGVGVASHRLPSAPRPGVGVASHLLASATRPGVGVASHLDESTARPGVGVASHLDASTARPGVGVASQRLPAAGSRPGVGVASHLLPEGAGVATSSQRVLAFFAASSAAVSCPEGWSHLLRFFGSPLSASCSACSLIFFLSSSRSRALRCSAMTSLYDRCDTSGVLSPNANASARDGESTRPCRRAWYSSSRSAMRSDLLRASMGSCSSCCAGTSSRCRGAVKLCRFCGRSSPSSSSSGPASIESAIPSMPELP
mmetsp:Transcript_18179/g.45575  ORF Transcript_18179/g.45575 Transcript_18179/m.45575 type:complete len:352 (+) Transcript_18179:2973-4028(+)